MSFDGLSVGITYGLRKIRINVLSLIIISSISMAAIFLTVRAGSVLARFFSEQVAGYLGGGLLVMIGFWLVYTACFSSQKKDDQLFKDKADFNADVFHESHKGIQGKNSVTRDKREEVLKDEKDRLLFSLDIKILGIIIKILKKPVAADFDQSGSISYREAVVLGLALALDALGAGLGAGLGGLSTIFFPLLIGVSKFIFVGGGFLAGKKIGNILPQHFKVYPGLILVIVGVITILY